MLQKTCPVSGQTFTITDEDLAFYAKMGVPAPTLCPQERQRRRSARRNELHLYHRKCDGTGQPILSIYDQGAPFPVYQQKYWWSDGWDPLDYGQDFYFNRPFFEQFHELQNKVPRVNLFVKKSENTDYANHIYGAKDCYLCADVGDSQSIYFSKWVINSRDCSDCYQIEKSELCYWTFYSVGAYLCRYCFLADYCKESWFLWDCRNCEHCFGCTNLRNKKYCFLNKQLSAEEYKAKIEGLNLASSEVIQDLWVKFQEFTTQRVTKPLQLIHCEDCSGDFLYQCKKVHHSFEVIESQDAKYCFDSGHLKDCYDVYESAYNCEREYECYAGLRLSYSMFTALSYDCYDLLYCDLCNDSQNLFGCISLKKAKNCILNKSYTQQEYESLIKKIIQHMKETGEFGEFFPISLSPFAYNETVAQEYYPLTREEALARGYRWREELNPSPQPPSLVKEGGVIPDNISEVPDSICEQVLHCEESGKPYKIQKAELKFYQKMNLPIPRLHPDVRHRKRMALRNPRQLFSRQCQQCQKAIQTTYAPERPEKVLCESCYLKIVN